MMTEREQRYSMAIDLVFDLMDDAPADSRPQLSGAHLQLRRAMERENIGPDYKQRAQAQ